MITTTERIITMQSIKLTVNVPEPALVAAVEPLLRGVHPDATPKPPASAPAPEKATRAPIKRKARPKAKARITVSKRKPTPAVPSAPGKGAKSDTERITGEDVAELLDRLKDAGVTREQLAAKMGRSVHALGLLTVRSRTASTENTAALRAAVEHLGCQDLW